ncbi:MAG: DEAD/DEAH box helicase, partial [Actinomycetia bacterium]|nr:DEAD/DEAH box helicase [Actinomycetes bacterium]
IEEEAKGLGSALDLSIGSFYGGVGYQKQEELIKKNVDLVIATPGRLLDFAISGKFNLRDFGILVIDEADRMFNMGFLPDVRRIILKMPKKDKRQTMLYSATLNYQVRTLSDRDMTDPIEIENEPEKMTVENVDQRLYHISSDEKISILIGIIKKEDPKNLLIFTNTKRKAEEVSFRLKHNGFSVEYLIGDLPQKKRLRIIDEFKKGKIKYLIATDVASRGLHVEDLEMVINYDMPADSENYVHRIGRTARAGKSGKAVSLVCEEFVYGLESIEKLIKQTIPVVWPEKDLFSPDKSAGKSFRNQRSRGSGKKSGSRRNDHRRKERRPHKRDSDVKDRREMRKGSIAEKKKPDTERRDKKKPKVLD